MGLTNNSTGMKTASGDFFVEKTNYDDKIIALAGNPNVGKSTVFNKLTGLRQHTGNWPGKTVTNAQGKTTYNNKNYILVDIPGTYSLMAHSREEEVARDFICFGNPDAVIVVCDATLLERNLNLVLQTLEITDNVVVCINLMDEAEKKGIRVNTQSLSEILGVYVSQTCATKKEGMKDLMKNIERKTQKNIIKQTYNIEYCPVIEKSVKKIIDVIEEKAKFRGIKPKWIALRLLDSDEAFKEAITNYIGVDLKNDKKLNEALKNAEEIMKENNMTVSELKDEIACTIVSKAEEIASNTVKTKSTPYSEKALFLDRILTSKLTGIPVMILLLLIVFWITISGANIISELLSSVLFSFEDILLKLFKYINSPLIISDIAVFGVYRVLAWVVSVMLPPMAIFFPLFTLLEDLGYLPRIAFNMDKTFKKCHACGKQALTMCMGFGCNAAGIVGCRIIDSKRERLIAMITNCFVPCNGRFPLLISVITMFFAITTSSPLNILISTVLLTLIVLLGITMTFLISFLLSKTLLKGEPSSFTLELPPYRKPQITQLLIRSVFDRTIFVLSRAVAVAAPAGLIIWLFANISVNGATLLNISSGFLEPFARLIGLDGVILLAFILGFPANEIVIPIAIMAYMSNNTIIKLDDLNTIKEIFIFNGWTLKTALCTIIFSLMHWPCSTTLLTIKKETGSIKYTFLSLIIPTLTGMLLCFIINLIS